MLKNVSAGAGGAGAEAVACQGVRLLHGQQGAGGVVASMAGKEAVARQGGGLWHGRGGGLHQNKGGMQYHELLCTA